MILEGLSLTASVAVTVWSDTFGSYPADVVFWSPLLLLFVLRLRLPLRLQHARQAIRWHTFLLYTVHWFTALTVLWMQRIQRYSRMLHFTEPHLAFMTLTTLLLLTRLPSPSPISTTSPGFQTQLENHILVPLEG